MANVKTDRFGQSYTNVMCYETKNGYSKGYVELSGQLYKLEPYPLKEVLQKNGKNYVDNVRITKIERRSTNRRNKM